MMDLSDWSKTIGNLIVALGGFGAVIGFFANWWGTRIAERISNRERAQHEQELERLKTQLEVSKVMVARYNEQQFTLYSEVWSSLFDLFSIGEDLWNRAERQKLVKFAKQLRLTKDAVGKGSLFIEDEHYRQLREILDAFANYEAGKNRLVELRESREVQNYEIEQIITNRQHLDRYTALIYEIRDSFKRQLHVQLN
jgi:hypothetical protein